MRLVIEKYKCLEGVELPLQGFVMVTGPPGSGRSSLIECLALCYSKEIEGAYIDGPVTSHFYGFQRFFHWPQYFEEMARGIYCKDLHRPIIPAMIDQIALKHPELVTLAESLVTPGTENGFSHYRDSLNNRLRLVSQRRDSLAARLSPPEPRYGSMGEDGLERERSQLQELVTASQKKMEAMTKEAGRLSRDPEKREEMLAAFKAIDEEKVRKLELKTRLHHISEEHQRRRLIADGGELDLEELEKEVARHRLLRELIERDDIKYAPGKVIKRERDDIGENLRLLGLGPFTMEPDGSYSVWGRPAHCLSSTERFKFCLAVAAAKMKVHGWPWLVIDWPYVDVSSEAVSEKFVSEFECVIWMEPDGKALTISPGMGSSVSSG